MDYCPEGQETTRLELLFLSTDLNHCYFKGDPRYFRGGGRRLLIIFFSVSSFLFFKNFFIDQDCEYNKSIYSESLEIENQCR